MDKEVFPEAFSHRFSVLIQCRGRNSVLGEVISDYENVFGVTTVRF